MSGFVEGIDRSQGTFFPATPNALLDPLQTPFQRSGHSARRVYCTKFMSTRPSTTLAGLLTPRLVANPFAAVRTPLRRWSSEEFEDGLAYGWQSWLRRWPGDSFFPALRF
jgi:hypothetical protein